MNLRFVIFILLFFFQNKLNYKIKRYFRLKCIAIITKKFLNINVIYIDIKKKFNDDKKFKKK